MNLTAAVDAASRRILAHRLAVTQVVIHAKQVLELALAQHGAPEIVNIDQLKHFTAIEFIDVALCADPAVRGPQAFMDGVVPGATTSFRATVAQRE